MLSFTCNRRTAHLYVEVSGVRCCGFLWSYLSVYLWTCFVLLYPIRDRLWHRAFARSPEWACQWNPTNGKATKNAFWEWILLTTTRRLYRHNIFCYVCRVRYTHFLLWMSLSLSRIFLFHSRSTLFLTNHVLFKSV